MLAILQVVLDQGPQVIATQSMLLLLLTHLLIGETSEVSSLLRVRSGDDARRRRAFPLKSPAPGPLTRSQNRLCKYTVQINVVIFVSGRAGRRLLGGLGRSSRRRTEAVELVPNFVQALSALLSRNLQTLDSAAFDGSSDAGELSLPLTLPFQIPPDALFVEDTDVFQGLIAGGDVEFWLESANDTRGTDPLSDHVVDERGVSLEIIRRNVSLGLCSGKETHFIASINGGVPCSVDLVSMGRYRAWGRLMVLRAERMLVCFKLQWRCYFFDNVHI